MKRWLGLLGAVLLLGGGLSLAPRLIPLPEWVDDEPAPSLVLTDRAGGELLERSGGGASIGPHVAIDSVDSLLIRATLAAEDRRFYRHLGVDPLALARALYASISRGRPIGGASTLTMQAVRLARGRPRNLGSRLIEIGWSLVLEAHRSKAQILEGYLNHAPYGAGVIGVAAASRRWFGKPPAILSPAEAALLAALPRAPSRLDPSRHPSAALSARNAILRRMVRLGWLAAGEAEREAATGLDLAHVPQARAPHFAGLVLESLEDAPRRIARIRTTLDPNVQAFAESALRRRVAELEGRRVHGGAVVVLDSRTSEVLALVGSVDFHSPDAGQVNAALAPRQPGSAVKPFTYAVAFAGSLRPSTILADVPASYDAPGGIFAPRNYAGSFAGPVPARLALANSWNVPAVEVLRRVGPAAVARGFEAVGLPCDDAERLGLGLTLGAGEVSLLDLAAAYACLPRGGTWIAPSLILEAFDAHGNAVCPAAAEPESAPRPALDPIACAWVNEILSDPASRAAAFERGGPLEMPGAVAAKTGTSSDWRDAWAVFYTTRHTVAVWMGNPDGAATDRITGAEGSATAAHAILESLEAGMTPEPFAVPEGVERRAVCPLSGCAAGPDCPQADFEPFRSTDPPLQPCQVHVSRRIDTETGRLARTCTPSFRIRRAVFVQLPERYALWEEECGLRQPPQDATECLCGRPDCGTLDAAAIRAPATANELAILRPLDGTVLALDPTLAPHQQELALEALAPAGAEVVWRIDGRIQGTTRGVHRLFWSVSPGSHRIEASVPAQRLRDAACVLVLSG